MEAYVKFIFFACGFCGALCLACIHMECSCFPGHISPASRTPLCCFLPQSAGHMWLECICGTVALPGVLLLWIYIFSLFKVWCGASLCWSVQGTYKLSEDFAKPYFHKYWTEMHDVTTIWKRNVCSFIGTLNAFDVRPTFDAADVQAILSFPPNPLKHVLCDVPDCGVDALSQFW